MKHFVLNQLGTPQAPTPEAVGIYLNEFLMDSRIISIPRPLRDLLVKAIIVPRRKYTSAEKYAEVWTNRGSPLSYHTTDLQNAIQKILGPSWSVHVGMRYGAPSLKKLLETLPETDEIYFLPLYPQYATATVESALDVVRSVQKNKSLNIKVLSPFYSEEWYVQAVASIIKEKLSYDDHLLFSYHGIPVSQEKKAAYSYYNQCLKTSELIANELGLSPDRYTTAFQSRVGFNKWLEPSTESVAVRLAESGVKSVKAVCPSFVADCLETIEEIGMELNETFRHNGGEKFELIPCLNSDPRFAEGLAAYLRQAERLTSG